MQYMKLLEEKKLYPTAIAVHCIRSEYQRNAQRYGQMSPYLDSVSKQIDHEQDMKALDGILDGVNDIVVLENHAWKAESERGKLEAR